MTDYTPDRVTLTDDELTSLAEVIHTVAHDAPDVVERVAEWVAAREAGIRAQSFPVDDLRARLANATEALRELADDPRTSASQSPRLHGKSEGVRLALSYVDEAARIAEGERGEVCSHERRRSFRTTPPHTKCKDCGVLLTQKWVQA